MNVDATRQKQLPGRINNLVAAFGDRTAEHDNRLAFNQNIGLKRIFGRYNRSVLN
jgi:hypothetical protein